MQQWLWTVEISSKLFWCPNSSSIFKMITGYYDQVQLIFEKRTLLYYKYPFLIFSNFFIKSTLQSQKRKGETNISRVLIIEIKEYSAVFVLTLFDATPRNHYVIWPRLRSCFCCNTKDVYICYTLAATIAYCYIPNKRLLYMILVGVTSLQMKI